MTQAAAKTAFQRPEISWHTPQPLMAALELGAGLESERLRDALGRLCAEPSLEPMLKTERWSHFCGLIGHLGCGVGLVVQGSGDAKRLAV